MVGDQRGAPTDAAYIADVTALAVARYLHGQGDYPFGLYHVSASGDASWHEYACFIARQARRAGLALTLTPADIRAVPASSIRMPRNARPMPCWTAAGWRRLSGCARRTGMTA